MHSHRESAQCSILHLYSAWPGVAFFPQAPPHIQPSKFSWRFSNNLVSGSTAISSKVMCWWLDISFKILQVPILVSTLPKANEISSISCFWKWAHKLRSKYPNLLFLETPADLFLFCCSHCSSIPHGVNWRHYQLPDLAPRPRLSQMYPGK